LIAEALRIGDVYQVVAKLLLPVRPKRNEGGSYHAEKNIECRFLIFDC
jgi:hypothetical protein